MRRQSVISLSVAAAIVASAVVAWVWKAGLWSPVKWQMYELTRQDMVPIKFYGQVLDEASQPIPGANISARLYVADWTYLVSTDSNRGTGKYVPLTLLSDERGRFSVTGREACSLLIDSIEKPGYAALTVKEGFYYSPGQPPPHTDNPDTPVVFQMNSSH